MGGGVLGGDLPGAVAGAIVDDDYLAGEAGGERRSEHTIERGAEELLFVIDRHNDGEQGHFYFMGGRWVCHAVTLW